ncbi:MAG: RnfABCDGE type electron transport complex subunit D [Bacteroidetes bacterium]|uniref:Ion-translocating oxidoreductase complex subunit D n=1 Tax=Candidatus Cryptobacteroides intestinavium TaxID=2840766 RepID=A0A9D9ERN3_9BACT|nr:RnfABCDGE type electron transport complex subunit D [Candidatus Cryptobacteroides intestinavium]
MMNILLVSPAPHLHTKTSTMSLMRDVVIALLPTVIVSILFYGWREIMILAVSVISCVLLEYLITRFLLKRPNTIGDWSAAVTGVLLALNLPATSPWWMVLIGAIVAIGVAKLTFGGLGQNLFNPALVGRVFLLISFPVAMTNWGPVQGFIGGADAATGATPLGLAKEGGIEAIQNLDYLNMLYANIGGSAGELSAIAIIIGFIYLLARKVIRPHITLSIWVTVFVFSGIMWLVDPSTYTDPIFNLLTGGILLGSVFMATDYVTSPMSAKGGIIFGVGIGLITMLIRYFGSYPEGVSFAILIMNSTVPLINKFCKSKKYGR